MFGNVCNINLVSLALVLPVERVGRDRWTVRSRVNSDQTENEHTPDAGQQIWKHSGNIYINSAFDAKISSAVRTSSVEEFA